MALFIRANEKPTLYEYSQRAPRNSTRAQITLSGTAVAGNWFVGVYGESVASEATFKVRGLMASLCPQRCSEHGRCVQNHCNCQAGYVGDDCSSERLMLSAGVPFRGAVSFNRWNYYTIDVQRNALEIQANETFNNFAVG